jgi:Zn-dependent peptidase ImmA (M78 family)
MRKPDDCTLTPRQLDRVQREAEKALLKADALGRFPTPVDDVLKAAQIEEVAENVLTETFLATLRQKAGGLLKRALGKILGVFDARAGLVFIDRTLHAVKQRFVRLHEAGHGFLRWQRELYAVVEDSEQTIDPDTADLFDREANVFASEVLFQRNSFSDEAAQHTFGVLVPVQLGKKYGASIYASIRRYVSASTQACAVLVLDPPVLSAPAGFECNLRRVVASERFTKMFGSLRLPDHFSPGDKIGAMVPMGNRRMSGRRSLTFLDQNGDAHECFAEAFTQKHQVFILILAVEKVRPTIVTVASKVARRS